MKHSICSPQQFCTVCNIVAEIGACEKNRTFCVKDLWVKWRNGARGSTIKHHVAAAPETIQAFVERIFPDRIVDHIYTGVICQSLDFGFKVRLGIKDYFI